MHVERAIMQRQNKVNDISNHLRKLFLSAIYLGLSQYLITQALRAVLVGKSANINAKLSHNCSTNQEVAQYKYTA
uniref:Uncharacterized protein n=1 Tax=Setaria italica TaxID=4555 RepID=K3Y0K5_SETIT